MRLLYAWHDHDGGRSAAAPSACGRRHDQERARRQFVPLHRLHQYRQSDPRHGRELMYPAAFRYVRPRTLDEARGVFGEASDAKYLAGGQTLIPAMRLRLAQPAELIDIARIPALDFIAARETDLEIGAAVTHADVAVSAEVKRS